MANFNELEQRVLADYGQYLGQQQLQPTQNGFNQLAAKYADGGYVDDQGVNLPSPQAIPSLADLANKYEISQNDISSENARLLNKAQSMQAYNPMNAQTLAAPEFQELAAKYIPTSINYAQELKQVRESRKAHENSFNESLDKIINQADDAPSQSELYFRLASAFANPGKTGSFGEALGGASGVLADNQAAIRKGKTAQQSLQSQIALKKHELTLENLKDEEKTLLSGAGDEAKVAREAAKEERDSKKPLSRIGEEVADAGLVKGTPEFNKEVKRRTNLEDEAKRSSARASENASRALTLAEERRGNLSPKELEIVSENKNMISQLKSAASLIDEASRYADVAFTESPSDKASYQALRFSKSNDQRVVATEQFQQIMKKNLVTTLKGAMGANPSNRDVQLLKEVQGLESASKESRQLILKRAKEEILQKQQSAADSVMDIISNKNRKEPFNGR